MAKLIVFSGLPGSGKSKLAERIGRDLSIPVYARDWLEAAIVSSDLDFPNKNDKFPNLAGAGLSLLNTLAERQLTIGQSAILDSTASKESIRDNWRQLAARHNAAFVGIHCVCSNEEIHKYRLENRDRAIPSWYELEWSQLQDAASRFESWTTDHLVVDSIKPFDANYALVKDYICINQSTANDC